MPRNTITYDKREHAVWLTLNNPSAGNIINRQLANDIKDACREINEDEEIRVVIITGAGEEFSRGADMAELSDADPAKIPASLVSEAVSSINCPVVAAINGNALGAGLELALSCDIRIASENALLGLPETSYGIIPGGGGTQRLARIIGKAKATELILTADPVSAEEAYRIGLLSLVTPRKSLIPEVQRIVNIILSRAPVAVKYAKEAVTKGIDMTMEQGLRLEADLSILLHTTEDKAEGVQAFIDKRQSHFKGK